jgi:hypothetical protein
MPLIHISNSERAALGLSLTLAAAGCLPAMQVYGLGYDPAQAQANQAAAVAQAEDATDAQMVKHVEDARSKAKTAPGSSDEARRWAGTLEAAYQTGTVARGKIDGASETAAVSQALDEAAKANAEQKPELLAAKGRLELLAGRKEDGVKTLEESMKIRPTTSALLPLLEVLDKDAKHANVGPLCKKTRPNVTEDDERLLLLDRCLKHSGQTSVDAGLAWASNVDIRFYKEEQAKAEARATARQRERDERAQQMMAESQARRDGEEARRRQAASGSSGGGSSGGPVSASVEIRSECSRTVPVFYGEKPKFGSGTRSSVSSNSISSAPRKADGTLTVWIIDGSENGIASAHASPGTRRIILDRSCASLRAE